MIAIFKKELSSFFHAPIGYLIVILFLVNLSSVHKPSIVNLLNEFQLTPLPMSETFLGVSFKENPSPKWSSVRLKQFFIMSESISFIN